ncbi:predicted membrane-associated Zn-dependent protease 1 [Solibacillus silvestris StLB046]|uniref:Predicted membrane-associated Zn-dependent protease 1 n=1 Tax=Solibacillus silvestris (strain StLB046) TaxID=1002809 RepID=F2FA42_SOLSS|nr:PqqD family protein [Solibacillus silvestris]BAK15708.1 predicted membrane-associated Zn-dependent protease 1 [Solibacillus silvestris StLB046]
MKVSLQSEITLYPLSIRQDKKHYIVEEPISGDFFELPEIGVDAIKRLEQGEELVSIEHALKTSYPDEEVDIIDFVEQLLELGLVQEVDGVLVKKEQSKSTSRSGGFLWIPHSVGRLFFNGVMNKIYLLLLVANIVILILNPNLFPHYKDIFLFDSMMLNIISYLFISLLLILIHEFGHILAIRSHDLPAKLSIGNRLIFIVFETDLTQAWKLDPKKRNILYLAGLSFEQVILFLSLGAMLLFPDAGIIGILGIIVLDIFIKFIYQCCFYMKTDVYYVVENITGCYNLMENGKIYLNSRTKKRRKDVEINKEMFQGEWNLIRLYSVFYIVGVVLTLILAVLYFVPQLYYTYTTIYLNLLGTGDRAAFWDAIAFLIMTMLMLVLLMYVANKQRHENS